MVAKVTVPRSTKRALNYSEQKVQKGQARCIHAENFLKEAGEMHFYEKLERFEQLISLNQRARTNVLHVSLNFDPSEKLPEEKLVDIGNAYMEKIGFACQPYLIYHHLDAGHPHVHIVSTNIREDGKRISLHNIGRNQSTQARKDIEIMFNLVKAEDQKKKNEGLTQALTQRVVYGKSETKRGITNVLDGILNEYKYSSLAELNAVLKLYRVMADRGKEEGIIFRQRGLVYRVLDERGEKIGVPIKASSIYSRPTLPFLEKKFKENEELKEAHKKSLKTSIDWILIKAPKTLDAFKEELQKEKISLVVRQNDHGIIYGLTYIDHRSKCVFNGSGIGKEYSAKAMLERIGRRQISTPVLQQGKIDFREYVSKEGQSQEEKIIGNLISPEQSFNYVPFQFRKRKRKKNK